MVVDTSVLLAVVFQEKHGPWCVKQLQDHMSELMMSTVNYAETLILIADRQPQIAAQLEAQILMLPIRFVSPTVRQAETAARARLKYPLNLGDCFAYALAKDERCGLLTLDRDFRSTDVSVVLPPKA